MNEFMNYAHFKIKSLTDVLKRIKKQLWITIVDFKDAFFMVPAYPYTLILQF